MIIDFKQRYSNAINILRTRVEHATCRLVRVARARSVSDCQKGNVNYSAINMRNSMI